MKKWQNRWLAATLLLMGIILLLPLSAKADNTKIETARAVAANQWITDTMGTASERYYKVEVPANGTVEVEFQRALAGATGKSWIVSLYGYDAVQRKNRSVISDTFNCTQTESYFLPKVGVEKGTVYVRVGKSSNTDRTLEYRFRANVNVSSDWETEFNNTFATADAVSLSPGQTKTMHGVCMGRGTGDYFKITLPGEGVLQASAEVKQNLAKPTYWGVTLYDSNEKYLTEFKCNSKDCLQGKSAQIGLPAGTYYAKVYISSSTFSKLDEYQLSFLYKAEAGWEHEQNKTYNEADAANSDSVYRGSLMTSSDSDWWQLNVRAQGRYQLDFRYARNKDSNKSWIVRLEDSDKKLVGSWTFHEKEKPAKCAAITLDKGTYYIRFAAGTYHSQETYRWSMNRLVDPTTIKKLTNEEKGIKVTWSASTDAKQYILQKRAGSGNWADLADVTRTSYLDKAVVNGTKYQYRVIAVAGGVRSRESALKTMWRLTAPAIRTKTAAANKITLTWKANNKGSGYQIQLATNSKFTSGKKTIKVKKAGTVKHVIKNLKWKTTYHIRIRAYKNSTNYVSAWSKTVKVKTK